MYRMGLTSSERWIFIFGDDSYDESDEFIALVKEYQSQLGGKITAVSDETQYRITNDPLKLIFQWDSLFGITVIVPFTTDITMAQNAMRHLCDRLNTRADKP